MKWNKPTYFRRNSLIDLINVLFCRGPKRKATLVDVNYTRKILK